MRASISVQRAFQLSIVLACFALLLLRFSSHSIAQTCSPALELQPPLFPGAEMAWRQGTNVSVKIYDRVNGVPTSTPEFDAIDAAIRDWNTIKITGCSNVTFSTANRAGKAWESADPISDDSLVVRWVVPTQFRHIWNGTHLKAGFVDLDPSVNLNTTDPL
jgi:hypothetical protein